MEHSWIVICLVLCCNTISAQKPHVKCEIKHKKVGCFNQLYSLTFLFSDRVLGAPDNKGHTMDWNNWEAYVHSLACRCNEEAKSKDLDYFVLRYYGICYGGKGAIPTGRLAAGRCMGFYFRSCDDLNRQECVGVHDTDYLYKTGRDGGYTKWGNYSSCSKTCGNGTKSRSRNCSNPVPSGYGKNCSNLGADEEIATCSYGPCSVDGGFSEWSSFGNCSKSCGNGIMIRSRSCSNPVPAHGGKNCTGPTQESRFCNVHPCPVDGGFSEWSSFGNCSKSCGNGIMIRSRSCTNPIPAHGGKNCTGPTQDSRFCNVHPCPVDGGFSEWSTFGACSKSCGRGVMIRSRSCTNPIPAHGGKNCTGPTQDSRFCNVHSCPVDGGFSEWSSFGNCSKSCGNGIMIRSRSCTNPVPAHGGKNCTGLTQDSRFCNVHPCPVDGGFSAWSTFGVCSKSCGNGIMIRSRSCTNPVPAHGGKNCTGPTQDSRFCNIYPCPVDGGFSEWSSFGNCSKSCGNGIMIRSRSCTNPVPAHGGKNCPGPTQESRLCNAHPCPVDGGFSEWSSFGNCSKSCGNGIMIRSRSCTNPVPAHGGKNCTGPTQDSRFCNVHSCPVDGGFSNWSAFGKCSRTCGEGVKSRRRNCNNPSAAHGGRNCSGLSIELVGCRVSICAGPDGVAEAKEIVEKFLLNFHKDVYPLEPPSGKFFKAINAIQEAVANEFAFKSLNKSLENRLNDLREFLKVATEGGSIDFARTALGKSLFIFMEKKIEDGLPFEDINKAAKGFLKSIKKDIGSRRFSEIMLEKGDATLMFAIDTSASMAEEIRATKAIANAIIYMRRNFSVDYILSPFNDPGHGPVTYKNATFRKGFINAIERLVVSNGYDCPELAFTGMIDALRVGPRLGSPMFVFTDASAKDDTFEKKQELKALADRYSTSITFFANPYGCGGKEGISSYREIAAYTSGQVFPLKTHQELSIFKDYVSNSLISDSIIAHASHSFFRNRGKRSFLSKKYNIPVDEGVSYLRLSLSVHQRNTAKCVQLRDHTGRKIHEQSLTTYNKVYNIKNPAPGTWRLVFPLRTGEFSFIAKAESSNPIDFMHRFIHKLPGDKNIPVVTVNDPLEGTQAMLHLQIMNSGLLDRASLKAEITDEQGQTVQSNINLQSISISGGAFKAKVNPPKGRFKIAVTGQTKRGFRFRRVSRLVSEAKTAFMSAISAGKEFTTSLSTGMTRIEVYVYNQGAVETFSFQGKARHGTVIADSPSKVIQEKSNTTTSFVYYTLANAASFVGKTDTVMITAVGNSGTKLQLPIIILIVS